MPDEVGKVLRELPPPPGGAAAFHHRLRQEPRRRRTRVVALGLAGVAGVAGLLLTAQTLVAPSNRQPSIDLRSAYAEVSGPREPAVIPADLRHRMALLRVPLKTDRVVFYYVAVLSEAAPDTAEPDEGHDGGPEDRAGESPP